MTIEVHTEIEENSCMSSYPFLFFLFKISCSGNSCRKLLNLALGSLDLIDQAMNILHPYTMHSKYSDFSSSDALKIHCFSGMFS